MGSGGLSPSASGPRQPGSVTSSRVTELALHRTVHPLARPIVPRPHPTSWPSCPVEIAALAAPYLLPRSSWSSRQPPNANECPRRAPRGQTRAHGPQSICRHRGNREAHRRRARTARESNCAAPALDQPSAAVASRGGPADCACADSRGCLTRDGCAIHRHANLDAHLLLRAAEPKNR